MTSVAKARAIALELPEVEEKPAHGIPTFRVANKLFASLREKEGFIAIKLDFDERDFLIDSQPERFFTNDHYRNYPMVLARLPKVNAAQLRELLGEAWKRAAPKRVLAEFGDEIGR
jgi:hypothetical protein